MYIYICRCELVDFVLDVIRLIESMTVFRFLVDEIKVTQTNQSFVFKRYFSSYVRFYGFQVRPQMHGCSCHNF